jgi:hypothetical protein
MFLSTELIWTYPLPSHVSSLPLSSQASSSVWSQTVDQLAVRKYVDAPDELVIYQLGDEDARGDAHLEARVHQFMDPVAAAKPIYAY